MSYPQLGPRSASAASQDIESPDTRRTHLLLIMGGDSDFQLGNFLGFVRVLSKEAKATFQGDFLTALDPDEELKKSGYSNFRFGIDNLARDVVVYTPGDDLPFEVVKPDSLPDRIKDWIKAKWILAKPNDAVNLILIGHGRRGEKGSITLGTKSITYEDIILLMKRFHKDVQVNVITTACFSGRLTDLLRSSPHPPENRYVSTGSSANQPSWSDSRSRSGRFRSSPFVRGWVSSLGSLSGLTLQDHKIKLIRAMATANPKSRSDPQTYTDALNSRIMEDILIRGYADVDHDPAKSHRRKRVERATGTVAQAANNPEILQNLTGPASESVTACLKHELRMTGWYEDSFHPPPHAIGLFEAATSVDANRRARLLGLLYFRARKQSAIFDTFMQLELMGAVSLECLALPIAIDDNSHDMVNWVLDALLCFDVPKQLSNHPQHSVPAGVFLGYDLPTKWLATMLVRSCSDLLLVFEIIWQSGYLGELNLQELAKFRQKVLVKDSRACPAKRVPTEHLGFFLPSGIQISKSEVLELADASSNTIKEALRGLVFQLFEERFDPIERAFQAAYGLSDKDLASREDEPVPSQEDSFFHID